MLDMTQEDKFSTDLYAPRKYCCMSKLLDTTIAKLKLLMHGTHNDLDVTRKYFKREKNFH